MKNQSFVDCFMLMGTALSLRGNQKLPQMGRPLLQDVFTTTVNVSFIVQELRITNERNSELEIVTLLNQRWVDPRLGANVGTRTLAVAGQIWKPKIVNINGKAEICNSEDTVFWRGFGEEGNILFSEKIRISTDCTKNYRRFPFDTQICEFKFGSYRFPQNEVNIILDQTPVEIIAGALKPDVFSLVNVSTLLEVDIRASGNFSVGMIHFHLKRQPAHYVHCIILPCFVLTLMNYATYFLDLNKRSTRLFINFMVFTLVLSYYYISVCWTVTSPYLKALDIFVFGCKIFALVTLLETLCVDKLCVAEETLFHLKRAASIKEYPKYVYWIEFGFKLSYPIFYIFFLMVFGFVYVE